jgi:twitching motility two-component system response regulator PilG
MTGNSPPQTGNTGLRVTRTVTHPRKAIKHLVNKQISGCLTVGDPQDPQVSWQVFLRAGKLTYATSVNGKTQRLQCLVRTIQPNLAKLEFSDSENEYPQLCRWWHGQGLAMSKLRQLLMRLSLEALVHVLALPETEIEFSKGSKVDPVLMETPLAEIPAPLWQMALQWQQWRKQIPSPFVHLYLPDQQQVRFRACCHHNPVPVRSSHEPDQLIQATASIFRKQLSLYEISTLLKVSVQTLVAWIQPFLNEGILVTQIQDKPTQPSSETPSTAKPKPEKKPEVRPLIACIDDSKTIQKQVKGILSLSGYDVLGITEPAQALTALVRQKPAAILMDVNMPDIDGYELCSMLRQSRQLREIPIIMLTGRDGILDRIRAKTLGVNFYLTKPFHPEHLVESIGKVLQNNPVDV